MSDQLLNVLSSKGEMNIEEFYNVFSVVCSLQNGRNLNDLTYERNRTIRLLDALGHCEFDYKRKRVYVCPPMLVGMPSIGLPHALLTGKYPAPSLKN